MSAPTMRATSEVGLRMASAEGADRARRQRVLAAEHEGKAVLVEHGAHDALELVQRLGIARRDPELAQGGHAPVAVGLAPQLLVEQLKRVAGLQDRGRA